jgi:hypothetical protein
MRLLLAAPRARLWLLEFDESAVDRCVYGGDHWWAGPGLVGRAVTGGPGRDWLAGP